MTDRELMQQALDALELLAWYENPATRIQVRKPRDGGSIVTMYPHKVASEAATALRAAIKQTKQRKPVAWRKNYQNSGYTYFDERWGTIPDDAEPLFSN